MEILIKGARLVDSEMDTIGDVLLRNGKIAEIGENLVCDCRTIDAKGSCVMPAFVDLHAHFRDPGYTWKEDFVTGSLAAMKGGFTFVNLMGNTSPICSDMEIVEYVLMRAEELELAEVHQCVSITKNFDGKDISHLDSLNGKVKMITDDGKGVESSLVMYKAMEKAKEKGLIVMSHAEDELITPIDYRLSENLETVRNIYLALHTGARLHLTHVSTKEAIEEIARGKAKGDNITCDVTPHHIALWDNPYRVNPPIRSKEDVDALIENIKSGVVDAIATDHAPHTMEDKEKGSPGLSGLETAFSVAYTTLVEERGLDIKLVSRLMSGRPAEIMGLNKGRLKAGYDADIVIANLDKEITVDPEEFVSKGKNTPFDGYKFKGDVLITIKDGDIKYLNRRNEEVLNIGN
ncbi:MAG: dihydroorotase [Gudongella sp.]|jgi:dihydroorotase|nr:dihydroorotase [Gudongella sp.]